MESQTSLNLIYTFLLGGKKRFFIIYRSSPWERKIGICWVLRLSSSDVGWRGIYKRFLCDEAETGSEKVQLRRGGEERKSERWGLSGGAVAAEVHRSLLPNPKLLQVTVQSIDADVVLCLNAFAASPSENFYGKRPWRTRKVAIKTGMTCTLDRPKVARVVIVAQVEPLDFCFAFPRPFALRLRLVIATSPIVGPLHSRHIRLLRHLVENPPVVGFLQLTQVHHLPGGLVAQLHRIRIVDIKRLKVLRPPLARHIIRLEIVVEPRRVDTHVSTTIAGEETVSLMRSEDRLTRTHTSNWKQPPECRSARALAVRCISSASRYPDSSLSLCCT